MSLGDLLSSNVGQVSFGFVGVLVNLTLQLTRREIISNLRQNMLLLLQTVQMYGQRADEKRLSTNESISYRVMI
jgi:hypothetical protein